MSGWNFYFDFEDLFDWDRIDDEIEGYIDTDFIDTPPEDFHNDYIFTSEQEQDAYIAELNSPIPPTPLF